MQDHFTGSPVLVDTPALLARTTPDLDGFPSLSIDTESNSLYVYREQVCLLQISTPEQDYLIDTLALTDLSPLAHIFANPKQEKIFHASEYDVICLKRDFCFEFKNIFDTMIAARILGEEAVGLAALLKSRIGIELDKKYQRSNWGIRPLPAAMLEYACQDSHYLFQLREILEKELKEKKLVALAQEDFRLACQVPAHSSTPQQKNCWKVAGANTISPQEAAILKELCDLREKAASRSNLPPFKIMSNDLLVKLCHLQPVTLDDLTSIKGMNERMLKKYGALIINAIQTGIVAAPLKRPKKVKPDEKFLKRYDALREWRKNKGKEVNVESDVILPREYCETIAAADPSSSQELELLMKDIPFRYKHFQKEILQIIHPQEAS